MREASIRTAFAKRHDLWYDIETGDLLSMKSARALTSTQKRVLDKQSHVLAQNAYELKTFLSAKEECDGETCHPQIATERFDLDLIENWSEHTLAILDVSDQVKETLDVSDIMAYEADSSIGKVLLVDRELKAKVITTLTSIGAQISFISREAAEQTVRSRSVATFTADLPMRKHQDRSFQIVQENILLTMVFDGHGSDNVIQFISSNYYDLGAIIAEPFPTTNGEALVRCREVFKKFETRIKTVQNASYSGSTAVLAAHKLSTKQCFFAHIGDSRAVWHSDDGDGATEDHKPNSPSEKKRIEDAGGEVTRAPGDAYRVNGNLSTSRSFGDTSLKVPANKRTKDFVSSVPDVDGPFTFSPGTFYALGTDGVFDVMSSEEIANGIRNAGPSNGQDATSKLAQSARLKGSADDITLVSVYVL